MIQICGQKLSLCCMLLSGWGVVQLTIMGIFYYIGAVNLVKDVIEFEDEPESIGATFDAIDQNFKTVAINCWVASAIYLLFLAFSACQYKYSKRAAANIVKVHE